MKQTDISTTTTARRPAWLIALRVLLGLILIWKGIVFIRDTALLKSLIENTGIGTFSQSADTFSTIVSILTLLCGIFIILGFFTRIASIVQIPILLVAVFFVNLKNVDRSGFELALSIIVLILLILFAIKGSGVISADKYFGTGNKARVEQ